MKLEALRASEQNTFQQESRGLELDENQGTEYDFLGVYYFPLLFFFVCLFFLAASSGFLS